MRPIQPNPPKEEGGWKMMSLTIEKAMKEDIRAR